MLPQVLPSSISQEIKDPLFFAARVDPEDAEAEKHYSSPCYLLTEDHDLLPSPQSENGNSGGGTRNEFPERRERDEEAPGNLIRRVAWGKGSGSSGL